MPTKLSPCPDRARRAAYAHQWGGPEPDMVCPGCCECLVWTPEERLATFAAALDAPNFSHVTTRSWCRVECYYVYRREPASPTQCELAWSHEVCPEADALLTARGLHAQQAGLRGHAACAAQMCGR